ncbi:MAG: hypothetical protein RLZZ369_2199, partial [Pseudomonadota bacterium]
MLLRITQASKMTSPPAYDDVTRPLLDSQLDDITLGYA